MTAPPVNQPSADKSTEWESTGRQKQPHPTRDLTSTQAVCIWIPLFPLRAEEQRDPDLIGKPTAVLSSDDSRRVAHVSALARRHGVQAGMTVSQAIGLCSSLILIESDPVFYDEKFTSIVASLNRLSPVVEPIELGRLYVGVDGMEGLYGNVHRQLKLIARLVKGWKGARLGWGRGKFASWVAAARAKPKKPVIVTKEEEPSFLASQPVAALPVHPDTHRRLWQLGIKTLGDLAKIPEVAIISQFGNEGRTAWQLATGQIVERIVGKERPEPIQSSVDFPVPLADTMTLLHALETLVGRTLRHPRRIGWRVQTMRIRAALEHGSSWLKDFTMKEPTASQQNLTDVIGHCLEQSAPTGAVGQLVVEFTGFVRGTMELQLFARDAASSARAGRQRALRWAAREIKTRLKSSMLHHIVEVHPWSRMPERRYALIDFDP
jgi:nucleotidyltransferase/DNA polymerase involved in DNA repair